MFANTPSVLLPKFSSLTFILFLSVGAELLTLVLILATLNGIAEAWDDFVVLSIFVQTIVLMSAAIVCHLRRKIARMTLIRAVIWIYIIVMLVSATVAISVDQLLASWGSDTRDAFHYLHQFIPRSFLISAIVTAAALRHFYLQQQWKQRVELDNQARLQAFQARIRPHFLFNSMNIIASLIPTQPALAEQVVEDLSELFRATLKETGSWVPLSEEQMLSQHYLRIEKLRLADRLQVAWSLEALPQDAAIPMLTIQPLVENAIYHGIQVLEQGGEVSVQGVMDQSKITIKIKNPYQQGHLPIHKGHGMAQENIKHRLALLFGAKSGLIAKVTSDTYEVILQFPYIKIGDLKK